MLQNMVTIKLHFDVTEYGNKLHSVSQKYGRKAQVFSLKSSLTSQVALEYETNKEHEVHLYKYHRHF